MLIADEKLRFSSAKQMEYKSKTHHYILSSLYAKREYKIIKKIYSTLVRVSSHITMITHLAYYVVVFYD